ncbi:MAG: hypothetical protein JO129_02820, partial [Candidatus Dependentiae bacterium]|nr:hypothetical protein [Candidatus Dependentiae bacterium]
MKKLYKSLFLIIFYTQQAIASNLIVYNLTSSQITVTLETVGTKVTQDVLPLIDPKLYDIDFYQNNTFKQGQPGTVIAYDTNPIQKLTIIRTSTNMPQVIYYSHENTTTPNQQPGGINNLNITGQGKMGVLLDSVEINKVSYPLIDLSSYINRCNQLKDSLSPTNLDAIQRQVDDLATNIKLVQDSDKAAQVGSQISLVQAAIDTISNNIKIMTQLNKDLQTVQNLQNNLPNGLNNLLDGHNNPANATAPIDQTQDQLNELEKKLKTLSQAGLTGAIYEQAKALQNAMTTLRLQLQQVH